jgi:hypothetical protein
MQFKTVVEEWFEPLDVQPTMAVTLFHIAELTDSLRAGIRSVEPDSKMKLLTIGSAVYA